MGRKNLQEIQLDDNQHLCDCEIKGIKCYCDYDEPPVRTPKNHKAKMGVSGRSIFTIWETMKKKAQNED